jgi:hypothetical protein
MIDQDTFAVTVCSLLCSFLCFFPLLSLKFEGLPVLACLALSEDNRYPAGKPIQKYCF